MAISVVCCYFLPFLFFLLAPMAFPNSLGAFLVGICGVSLSSLILYLQSISNKETKVVVKTVVEKEEKPATVIKQVSTSEFKEAALQALKSSPNVHIVDKNLLVIESLKQDLSSQKELFLEELESLQTTLKTKEECLKEKEKEIEDLKFELYTLLRIENRSKLLTASL